MLHAYVDGAWTTREALAKLSATCCVEIKFQGAPDSFHTGGAPRQARRAVRRPGEARPGGHSRLDVRGVLEADAAREEEVEEEAQPLDQQPEVQVLQPAAGKPRGPRNDAPGQPSIQQLACHGDALSTL